MAGPPALAGRRMVQDKLGIDTRDLRRLHPGLDGPGALADHMERQARDLDQLDHQLRRLASDALDRLRAITRGDHSPIQSHGVLRILGSDIETTGARFDQARDGLETTIAFYRQATAEQLAPAPLGRPTAIVQGRSTAALTRSTPADLPTATALGAEGTQLRSPQPQQAGPPGNRQH
ncbi:hypothetical protein [Kitasatospora sp. GAS1066B]|uniref:hypothetical protein n=1 Tax=Kitasatospora sp. GAS1066B TaxID=3156271 RepID=UPI003513301E